METVAIPERYRESGGGGSPVPVRNLRISLWSCRPKESKGSVGSDAGSALKDSHMAASAIFAKYV